MKKILINIKSFKKKSVILFQNNITNEIFNICNNYFNFTKIYIICDFNIYNKYVISIIQKFKLYNIKIGISVLNVSEKMKNIYTINIIYNELIKFKFNKNDLILSIGGGIISDISNFVANTYIRGINICNIPTTLLAQVDAAIGGKCGVNSKLIKNNIGCYNITPLIIIDTNITNELPKKIFNSGISEIIKYGFIADQNILLDLLNENFNINNIIYKCINIKKRFVEKDFYSTKNRLALNFGHTIGHAIESINNYNQFCHGEAVAIGIYYSIKLGIFLKKNKINDLLLLIKLLKKFNLDYKYHFNYLDIYSNIIYDKKIECDNINFVFAENGNFFIEKINLFFLKKLLQQIIK